MTLYTKAHISNRFVEVTQQTVLPLTKRTSLGGRKPSSNLSIEKYETYLKISINRARRKIRRLFECNFADQYAFLTLTFKPSVEIDVTDIKSCYEMFAKFKKRLKSYLKTNNLPEFKYVGVTEFQDKNQGAIHYHLICNLIELPGKVIQEKWQYGDAHKDIVKSDPTDNEKITHYLNKGIADPRLNGSKKYFHSHGLKKPIILDIEDPEEFYNLLNKCQPTLKHDYEKHYPFTGEFKYKQYYVNDPKELNNYVQELF
ncbi:hypothetical protein CN481_14190 [Bacillus sp. AFS006103]|nr:hypothetical protein CN481_14190 [Bacillus sp. AFS006103]